MVEELYSIDEHAEMPGSGNRVPYVNLQARLEEKVARLGVA